MSKISIRFYDDKEVRAVEENYAKNRNYWKYLKAKLKKENSQLVSGANQLKLTAADGKKYLTDLFDYDRRSNERRVLMKGIDYSYYYEQEDTIVEGNPDVSETSLYHN